MAEYSRIATGTVTSNGGDTLVIIPFTPNKIEIFNRTRAVAQNGTETTTFCITKAWWYSNMGNGAAGYTQTVSNTNHYDVTGYIAPVGGSSSSVPTVVSGTGFTSIQAALSLQYGPKVFLGAGGGITKANGPTITTTAAHGLTTGDWIIFQNLYQTASTGMQQIAGIPFMVTVVSPTTFTINWDTSGSNYTAITTGGLNTNASFMKISYPVLYAPGVSFISAVTLGATTTIVTTAPHNFVAGQEIAFRIPIQWGPYQLNSLPNLVIPGSPIYAYVTSVTNSTTFVCNVNSSAFNAFVANQPFANFKENFPQVVAVGDVNTGGYQYIGGALYPSPRVFNGFVSSTTVGASTINGPAIQGAYYNATFQGFIIGSGISGTAADVIDFEATLSDINYPYP